MDRFLPGERVIDYVHQGDGEVTRRAIRVDEVRRSEAGDWCKAYCFKRRAPRGFRLEGVVGVFDPKTRELVTDRARIEAQLTAAAAERRAGCRDRR